MAVEDGAVRVITAALGSHPTEVELVSQLVNWIRILASQNGNYFRFFNLSTINRI